MSTPVSLIQSDGNMIPVCSHILRNKNFMGHFEEFDKIIITTIINDVTPTYINLSSLKTLNYTDIICSDNVEYMFSQLNINKKIHKLPEWKINTDVSKEEDPYNKYLKNNQNIIIVFNNNNSEDKPIIFSPYFAFINQKGDDIFKFCFNISDNGGNINKIRDFYRVYRLTAL
jgi:hypothetical protein